MSLIKTVSSYDFHEAFTRSDTYKDQFSYNARQALFEYLDDLSDQTDTPIELDIVAICCDYIEYPSLFEAVDDYTEDAPYLLDEDELEDIDTVTLIEKQTEKAREYLEYRTTLIEFNSGIIIQNF